MFALYKPRPWRHKLGDSANSNSLKLLCRLAGLLVGRRRQTGAVIS
jgi:hypothetical protein